MTAALLVSAGAPLIQRYFQPPPLAEQMQLTPLLIVAMLDFCLAAAFLALWRTAPDFRPFRSLGFFYFTVVLQQLLLYFGGVIPSWSVRSIAAGLLVETAGEAMRIPRRGWTRFFWPVYLFGAAAAFSPSLDFFRQWPFLISEIPLLILIVVGMRSSNRRDRVIAVVFLVYSLLRLDLSPTAQRYLGMKDHFSIASWQWQYTTVGLTLLGAVILTVFARDLIRDRGEKQRLAAELAASRAIQQMIIPQSSPEIPGFLIHAKYQPFGEVGGDFFQVLTLAEGGAILVIGDVSGKGTPAAMLVSLLMGSLLALVETTTSPGQLLAGLNRCIQGRSCDGFTTCLILRLGDDGAITFANAGHIPPYRDGKELPCENGLPLGLVAAAGYPESTFELEAGEQITLLTDGVLEARSVSGELFGFERTAAISAQDADTIARAADEFGQEDDITVLTVKRATGSVKQRTLAAPV
jgi:serine phosphatase RsbU (regulator of sigma subunit)